MNYSPRGLHVWDAWTMPRPDHGLVHMYHLQRRREGVGPEVITEEMHNQLGHAVSTDLVNWEERPAVFGPDPANPHDDMQPWTGCTLWHKGRGYLFYTMRGSANGGREQAIGLATSEDGVHWTRHAGNPVIEADPRWYATAKTPTPSIVDCRDLLVIPHPEGGWIGYYATRVPAEDIAASSAIACVRSYDLIHWESLPPAFVPGDSSCVEVPDVFEVNGRWFMICLTGNFYGNRGYWSDPNVVNGTIYAVADRPEGPFRYGSENVLLAARTTGHVSSRALDWEGEKYLLYTDRERVGREDHRGMCYGTITTPKLVHAVGDRLYLAYSPRIESRVTRELFGPASPARLQNSEKTWGQIWPGKTGHWTFGETIEAEARHGWTVQLFDTEIPASFILEADVTIHEGVAAGLLVRIERHMAGSVVELNAAQNLAGFHAAPAFDWSELRQTPVPRGLPLHLRIVNRLEHMEVYVNDDLRLAFSRYAGIGGAAGLWVDRARASFTNLRLRELQVDQPN